MIIQMKERRFRRRLSLSRLAASSSLGLRQAAEGVSLLTCAVVTRGDEDETRRSLADGHQSLLADLDAVRAAVFESDNRTWHTHTHPNKHKQKNTSKNRNTLRLVLRATH